MTRDDAISVTEMILNSWTAPHWTEAQTETYVNSLVPYDADLAVHAVALAHKNMSFRPAFADLLKFYNHLKREADQKERDAQPRPGPYYVRSKMPEWVREWICARFLYARFGRPQDMRRFPQMGDWGDHDVPLMPPGEWAREAEHVTEKDAWKAIGI